VRRAAILAAALAAVALAPVAAQADFIYPFFGVGRFGPPPPPGGSGCGFNCLFFSNIDARATLQNQGKGVVVTGPIRCAKGDRATLRITLTQRSTTSLAQVGLHGRCTGTLRAYRFPLKARVGTFKAGAAFACLLGATERGGHYVDVNQWCRRVKLTTG
jgi:hypothetical protein